MRITQISLITLLLSLNLSASAASSPDLSCATKDLNQESINMYAQRLPLTNLSKVGGSDYNSKTSYQNAKNMLLTAASNCGKKSQGARGEYQKQAGYCDNAAAHYNKVGTVTKKNEDAAKKCITAYNNVIKLMQSKETKTITITPPAVTPIVEPPTSPSTTCPAGTPDPNNATTCGCSSTNLTEAQHSLADTTAMSRYDKAAQNNLPAAKACCQFYNNGNAC